MCCNVVDRSLWVVVSTLLCSHCFFIVLLSPYDILVPMNQEPLSKVIGHLSSTSYMVRNIIHSKSVSNTDSEASTQYMWSVLSMYTNVLCLSKTFRNRHHKQYKWISTSLNFSLTPIHPFINLWTAILASLLFCIRFVRKKMGNQCKSHYHNMLMSIIVSVKNFIMWFTLFIFYEATLKHRLNTCTTDICQYVQPVTSCDICIRTLTCISLFFDGHC